MDQLTELIYSNDDPLSILCGYLNKIMQELLEKHKNILLIYLLIEQKGKIFDGLLNHLQHHSLASLLIKLMEVRISPLKCTKIKKTDNTNSWMGSDASDDEDDMKKVDTDLSENQKIMQTVLTEKSTHVVNFLID